MECSEGSSCLYISGVWKLRGKGGGLRGTVVKRISHDSFDLVIRKNQGGGGGEKPGGRVPPGFLGFGDSSTPSLSPYFYCSSGERGLLPLSSIMEGRNSNKKLKSRSNRNSMFRSSRCILMRTLSSLDTRTEAHQSNPDPSLHVLLLVSTQ